MSRAVVAVALVAAAAAAALSGAGCAPDGSRSPPAPAAASGYGFIEVRVIDAPFPADCFAEASITIEGLEIQPTGSVGEQGFATVTTTAQTFDLLQLAGGRSETFATAVVPAGGYARARFGITAAVLTWRDGFQRRFDFPPDAVKVVRPMSLTVHAGTVTTLTLDIDLAQSFRQPPGAATADCEALKEPERITFSPVVRLFGGGALRMINGIVTDGQTGQGFPRVTVTSKAEGGPARTTLTGDGSGGEPAGFFIIYAEPRTLTLTFEAHDGRTRTTTVQPGPRDTFETVNVTIR